jgi:type II secretory pathway component PulK
VQSLRTKLMSRETLLVNRRGLVLIVVMVSLALFAALSGVLLKLALTEQRQARMEEWCLQSEWIVESAIERAAAQLAQSETYAGESWQVPAERLGEGNTCVALIQIERDADRENLRQVRVIADFRRDGQGVARRTKEITIELQAN